MSFLKKIGLGFAKVEAAVHVEAKLPPELENFNILKEEKNVAAALKEKNFVQAQEAVQQKPNDAAALAALQAVVANAHKVYNTSIEARLQEVDLKNTCRKVVIAGNEDFLGVYDNMWKMTVKADRDGCDKYQTALVSLTMPNKSIKQTTSDPATLYRHAAQIFVTYQTFVNGRPAQLGAPLCGNLNRRRLLLLLLPIYDQRSEHLYFRSIPIDDDIR